jgi:YVTN family beta-propeller protein
VLNVGSYPYGVAISPDNTTVYVANINSNNVSVIDTTTNTVTATVPVGQWPSGVAVAPDGPRVYVTNKGINAISVIDTATNNVTATVSVGNQPSGVAVTPDGTKVYVMNMGSNNVSIINTATNTATATVNVEAAGIGKFIGGPVIPTPDFSASPTTGNQPTPVEFIDKSTGSPNSWEWLLGDGGYITSKIPINPVHTCENAGNYNISLKVKNAWGSNEVVKFNYITATLITPTITWSNPANITHGTPLSNIQLDATSSVPGSFAYNPVAGTVLDVGTNTLSTRFTPTDIVNYTTATDSVSINVTQATPTLAWTYPLPSIVYGTALDGNLDATAKDPKTGNTIAENFVYKDDTTAAVVNSRTVLSAGPHILTAFFTK